MIRQDSGSEVPLFCEDEIKLNIKHPLACLFHLFFRTSAILLYLFCEVFSRRFIVSMVIIVLLLSCDFWTVKVSMTSTSSQCASSAVCDEDDDDDVYLYDVSYENVTGRLLVGLRWCNQIKADGKSHWIFESRPDANRNVVSNSESQIFWLGLTVSPLFWVFFVFSCLFAFNIKWLVLVLMGALLQLANLYGYVRCKMGGGSKLKNMATNYFGLKLLKKTVVNKSEEL